MPEAALQVSGRDYGGWTSMRCELGMDRMAARFELAVTDRWAGQAAPWPIRAGDACRLLLDGELVLDGYVDDRNVEYDRERHEVRVTGRCRAGDLVDCSAPVGQTNGRDLLQIAQAVCKPFGVEVTADVDVGKPFDREYAEPGQTAQELLSTLAAHRAIIAMSDGLRLRLTREGKASAGGALEFGALEFGANIEAAGIRDSMRERFAELTVLHQSAQSDFFNGQQAAGQKAVAKDPGVRASRKRAILADDGGDLQARANHEARVRAGKARSVTYTVSGWRAAAGSLWRPNTLVPVTDPNAAPAMRAEPMLIVAVAWTLDAQGARTELTLMRPGAFDALATPDQPQGLFQ